MDNSSNVIDLKSRRKVTPSAAQPSTTTLTNDQAVSAPVLDMTERRNEMLSFERRKVRRTILSEFIGAHIVVPDRGLQRATIYDISEDGIAFDVDIEAGAFQLGEEIGFRVYLNQQTYFPFLVRVANVRLVPEEGVARHGASLVRGAVNDDALHHFVKFIETVSASLRTDHGDVMVSGLRR